LRCAPASTLFPYTTLFRSRFALTAASGSCDGVLGVRLAASAQFLLEPGARTGTSLYAGFGIAFAGATSERGAGYLTALVGFESRSEEHTSELQSLRHLVCR